MGLVGTRRPVVYPTMVMGFWVPLQEDSRSSEGSRRDPRQRRKGKGKTPKRARRPAESHPPESDPFVTCSDGDGRDCRHR